MTSFEQKKLCRGPGVVYKWPEKIDKSTGNKKIITRRNKCAFLPSQLERPIFPNNRPMSHH